MDVPIIWNMDPELIRLGSFAIRWYGLMFAIAFFAGTLIITRIFRLENKPAETVDRLLLYMLVAVVVGARLGETVFYNPSYFLQHPFDIIKVWEGGLASHGAVIGILIALFLYSKKTPGQPFLWVLDRICIVVALGGGFIRIGNFFNSEIIGKPTQDGLGVIFQRVDNLPRHPAQLYESATYFILFLLLILLYKSLDTNKKPGLLVGIFLTAGFSARFLIEFVKENLTQADAHRFLSTGQRLSIPVIILGLYILGRALLNKRGTKG
jgi:prolipoprotein diacylglyceryl transferase